MSNLRIWIGLTLAIILAQPTQAQEPEQAQAQTAAAVVEQPAQGQTGTDPRDFAPKFMPYMRTTELGNGLIENQMTLFGLFAINPKLAITYEVPLAYERDVTDTSLRDPMTGLCGGSIPGGGLVLPNGQVAEGDCQEIGVGDMNMRIMYTTNWTALGGDWIIGSQFNFPTASSSVLGGETFSLAPFFAYVRDITSYPAPGAFFALMNFYQFDVARDDGRPEQSMYIGRWFVMLPINEKHKIYLLPEFQPIYDFEADHFSFWVGPEIGKMFGPGQIGYIKPGWGVNVNDIHGDREFTFEIGFRWFLN
jgi:hypothetical protein